MPYLYSQLLDCDVLDSINGLLSLPNANVEIIRKITALTMLLTVAETGKRKLVQSRRMLEIVVVCYFEEVCVLL